MSPLTSSELRAFAENGYIILRKAVAADLVAAAQRDLDAIMAANPPPAGKVGPHFYWRNGLGTANPMLRLLTASRVKPAVEAMLAPLELAFPVQAQLALNIEPFPHRPGGPHIDGLTPLEPHQRPGTFSLLAGILLTDQLEENSGNLWVWPGSHHAHAAHLREHGPEAIREMGHPKLRYERQPEQILGRAGDVVLAHYLLGHNIGGNFVGPTRKAIYLRLQAKGHAQRWQQTVQDPLLEFPAVREAMG